MQFEKPERTFEGRETTRSSVYIAGTLFSGVQSTPAKIRNLSIDGALVEVTSLPSKGSSVRLARGSLSVEGIVMWAARGRCGIKFNARVSVSTWVAPAASTEQNRVDQAVATLKRNGLGPELIPSTKLEAATDTAFEPQLVAGDLREMRQLINQVEHEILQEQILIQRHGAALQNLDIVGQALDVIARLLADGHPAAEDQERLKNLRLSRKHALGRHAELERCAGLHQAS